MNDDREMTEDKIPDRIEILMVRYLAGESTSTEISELEQWVDASPENKKAFQAFKKAWFFSALNKENKAINVDRDWSDLRQQLTIEAEVKQIGVKRINTTRWLGLVASLMILLFASWWIFLRPSPQIEEVTALSGVMDHILDDGSTVSLNQGSTIQFLTDLKNERKVVLDGDAFFDVARDPDRPFRIATQNLQIEVLGTSFYVDAREGQSAVQVIVQTGQVAFGKDQNKILLEAGQTGIYDKSSGEISKISTTDANFLSWRSNRLIFDETPLSQVVFAINRQFGRKLVLGTQDLENCELTATYSNQSFESVVRILEQTFDLVVAEDNDQFVLTGTGCSQ
ncbi:MAG: FecR domain-containing protein [Saprospiraceae bacterium]|nr:FecR domain-containing protein [Saprospiraceae bacterium]